MSELTLLTAPDCHLCEHAKAVLDELGVPWHPVDAESPEGRALAEAAPPLRPVLYDADGRVMAYGRLSLKRLRKHFDHERAAARRSS